MLSIVYIVCSKITGVLCVYVMFETHFIVNLAIIYLKMIV